MIATYILLAVTIWMLVIYLIRFSKDKPKNFPPGPPRLPIYGSYWFMLKENFFFPYKALLKMHKKYKSDVIGLYLGKWAAVTCYEYNLCKEMLTREEFNGRVDNVIVRNRGFGKKLGIFFTDGTYWKDQRWFSLRHMRDYGFGRRDMAMEDAAADELKSLIDFFMSKPKPYDNDVCTERGIVRMPDVIYGPAINCIHHTLSSRRFDDLRELRNVARAASTFMQSIDTTGNTICITPWLRFIAPEYFGWTSSFRDNETIFTFARKVVEDHKKTFVRDHPRDFIDIFLDEMKYLDENNKLNTSFSDEQLLYTVVDYMFPAPVGIGHTLNYLFAHLINKPEVQLKIQKEIDEVVGRARLPTLDDRKNLPYTEACLREVMRKETLVPLSLARRCTEDTTFGGYSIAKDTVLLPNLWGMHNDPNFWGDPENFRPERFLDDKGFLLKKDYSLPFGAGKRLCAGETFARNTLFIFLTGVMQNFTLKTPKGKPPPNLKEHKNGITLSIKSYWMETVSRAN